MAKEPKPLFECPEDDWGLIKNVAPAFLSTALKLSVIAACWRYVLS